MPSGTVAGKPGTPLMVPVAMEMATCTGVKMCRLVARTLVMLKTSSAMVDFLPLVAKVAPITTPPGPYVAHRLKGVSVWSPKIAALPDKAR